MLLPEDEGFIIRATTLVVATHYGNSDSYVRRLYAVEFSRTENTKRVVLGVVHDPYLQYVIERNEDQKKTTLLTRATLQHRCFTDDELN